MTNDEMSKRLAEEVMGWKYSSTWKAYFFDVDFSDIDPPLEDAIVIYEKDWNPPQDIAQAYQCLYAFLDKHPEYVYKMGQYYEDDDVWCELSKDYYNRFMGVAPLKQESLAICKAIIKAMEVEGCFITTK